MMDDAEKDPRNVEIPADVADAWAAVILNLALKADPAGVGNSDGVDERETFYA